MNGDGRSIGGSGSDISKEGGGLGEGGLQILPGSTLADFFGTQIRSTGVAKCDFFFVFLCNFGQKSDAKALNMLILDQNPIAQASNMLILACQKS